jgi:predicted acylesterase/phospholipase RssA
MAVFDFVFEGGGAKGSAFVGALNALAEQAQRRRWNGLRRRR